MVTFYEWTLYKKETGENRICDVARHEHCAPMLFPYRSIVTGSFSINFLSQIRSISRFTKDIPARCLSTSTSNQDAINAQVVAFPKLSHEMSMGRLVRWLKQPGDRIEMYDILMEVETEELVENVFKVRHACTIGCHVHTASAMYKMLTCLLRRLATFLEQSLCLLSLKKKAFSPKLWWVMKSEASTCKCPPKARGVDRRIRA